MLHINDRGNMLTHFTFCSWNARGVWVQTQAVRFWGPPWLLHVQMEVSLVG
jgi:hypothetical protein